MGALRKNPPPNAAKAIQELAALGGEPLGIAASFRVSLEVFEEWLETFPKLQYALCLGREIQRQELHQCVLKAAKAGITAGNRNAMYLLSTKFGYVEADRGTNVNVDIKVPSVMVVIDHGTDEEWEARAAAQQRALTLDAASPSQIAQTSAQPTQALPEPSYAPTMAPPTPSFCEDAPVWRGNA